MKYGIYYHSHNLYQQPVQDALFEFLILPCNDDSQVLLEVKMKNSSLEEGFYCHNSFGFKSLRIRPQKNFTEFKLDCYSKVEKTKKPLPFTTMSLTEQLAILDQPDFYIEHHLYLSETHYTGLRENARILVLSNSGNLLDFLIELNHYVNTLLTYEPNATTVQTSAEEAMDLGKGVCQDFTHLFLAMTRKNKVPARYVSGYLNQGQNYVGSAMMHAWAEVYVPGIGWTGFDPTNNLQVNEHYIKVCHGRDYTDCTPIKGILHTSGDNTTHHHVEVSQQ